MSNDEGRYLLGPGATLQHAMELIDQSGLRMAVIISESRDLMGTVTDGDVRRALINRHKFDTSVLEVMNPQPITVTEVVPISKRLSIMREHDLLGLPVLDGQNKFVKLELHRNLLKIEPKKNPVLIAAGGLGERLLPLTKNCPKPMLKLGGKPMLERLLIQLKSQGFYKFYISTFYMSEVIKDYFGCGKNWNIEITYLEETSRLGTGGALGLLPEDVGTDPIILLNSDVLTRLDFSDLINWHDVNNFDATVTIRETETRLAYGVVYTAGSSLTGIDEKPVFTHKINMGIYVVNPKILGSIQRDQRNDITDLLGQWLDEKKRLGVFLSHAPWIDVGQMQDFKRAQQEYSRFL